MADGRENSRDDFSAAEWESVKDLVYRCQSDPPVDLDRFLADQQASPKVRNEVKRLLSVSPEGTGFLSESATEKHLGVRVHQPLRIGKYRVMEQIGSGGSGVVYAAWDEALNRKVAVKVLRPEAAGDPESRKRLRWDARAASALQHPNIVVVHEVGSDGGIDYVAMECIAGQTLSERIHVGPLDNREVLAVAIQICSGLEAAHASGIVHRDLKPGNIMITEQGVVKILDFGLAKHFDSGIDAKDAPETVEGRFAGTVAYVSPEQADAKPVDARSDIFSFGSVLYEMLTGKQAFPGTSTVSVLADIMLTNPRPVDEVAPKVDSGFQRILTRCMRKDRERRFQSIAEVRVRLRELEDQILHPETDSTVILPTIPQVPKPLRRFRVAWVAAALGIALLGAGAAWLFLRNGRPDRSEFTLTRITADRGVSGYPALSPDGTLLAYASDRGNSGNLNIFVQSIKGGDTNQLTHDSANDYDPVFSPDGSTLMFSSDRDGGGLYSVTTLGGNERLLVRGGSHGRYSPDGRWIAYDVGDGRASLMPGSVRIFVMPVYGGVPEPLAPQFAAAEYPIWSPDGSCILFLGRRDPSVKILPEWWAAAFPNKGEPRNTGIFGYFRKHYLNHLALDSHVIPATWLADGTLMFPARVGDSSNIWGIRLDAGGVPHGEPWRLTAGTTIEWRPTAGITGQNHLLAYESMTFDSEVWELPLDAQSRPANQPHTLVNGYPQIASSSLSVDGRRMVFSIKPQVQFGAAEAILMADLDTGLRSQVTKVRSRGMSRPIISGDGKMVLYWDEGKARVISVEGGTSQPFCQGCGVPTHLNYDGSAGLFESNNIGVDQILYATQSRPPKALAALDPPRFTMQSGARFSPDNRWIAFATGNSSPLRQIFLAPLHPGTLVTPAELIPITDGKTIDIEPYWSTDGNTIFFISRRDGFDCVWAQHLNEAKHPIGPAYEVAPFHHPGRWLPTNPYPGSIGLSAGPRSLIFTVNTATSDIWIKSDHPLSQ